MVISCSAYNCTNRQGKKGIDGSNILFHRFPLKNPELLKSWLIAMKRDKWKPTKYSFICSEHFLSGDYRHGKNSGKWLKVGAVPTVFSFPSHLVKNVKPRRKLEYTKVSHATSTCTTGNDQFISVEVNEPEMEVDGVCATPSPVNHQLVQTSPYNSPAKVALKRKVKALQMQRCRLKKKVTKMADLIGVLKRKCFGSQELIDVLEHSFEDMPILPLLRSHVANMAKNKCRRRYSKEMQEFALTMYFYSPKAYKFVRKFLILPHKSLITKWITSIDGEPGILNGVLKYIKENNREKTHLRDMALIIDSMAIRAQQIYDKKSGAIIGNTNLAGIIQDSDTVAREALFLQVVSYSTPFKAPVAYFLIDKVNSDVQSQIITTVIESLSEAGVAIRSLTCDGTQSNLTTLRKLGCMLPDDSTFPHPQTGEPVAVFLDACHMLKLARNALAECKNFESPEGTIDWEFIKRLASLQEKEGLKFANKLNGRHINFSNKVMNVSLAAQTLSSGVADAIEYLRKCGNPDFIDSEATVLFIRRIDQAFDILNSRSPFGKGFKQPIRPTNVDYVTMQLAKTAEYIKTITVGGTPILRHRRRTFALGFLTCFNSLEMLSKTLFTNCGLKYFLTYKVSQDHLELLFNCIRGLGGWNNNPNCIQLKSAVRKVQLRSYIAPTVGGNCRTFEEEEVCGILGPSVSPKDTKAKEDEEEQDILLELAQDVPISCWSKNILTYIAGFILKKVLPRVNCMDCRRLLVNSSQVPFDALIDHNYCRLVESVDTSFVYSVNRGGLTIASPWVHKIVAAAEAAIKGGVTERRRLLIAIGKHRLELQTTFTHPIVTGPDEDLHETSLIKMIGKTYADLRLRAEAQNKTLKLQKNMSSMRHRLTKVITFNNL